jgi:hypothetical protein
MALPNINFLILEGDRNSEFLKVAVYHQQLHPYTAGQSSNCMDVCMLGTLVCNTWSF